MTPTQRRTAIDALRLADEIYRQDSKRVGVSRLATHFIEMAERATELADLLEMEGES